VLQLPTLRAVARVSKRRILIGGQLFAVVVATPILLVDFLGELGPEIALSAVLFSFSLVAAGLNVSNTVWFSLLRGYVEPDRIGHFFGLLRSGWHFALIVYYLGAQLWLSRNPGDFETLFAAAWGLGALRIALILRLPERSERTPERIRVREAFALVRNRPELRSYLVGVAAGGALRTSTLPFAIVMMRRAIGFSEADVILATLASYGGGLVSLYLWGRLTDRIGAAPVFRMTSLGLAALLLLLLAIDSPGAGQLALVLVFFFGHAVLTAGFGVADTHVLFGLTPPEAPARTLVIASVLAGGAAALAPILVGLLLDVSLARAHDDLSVYHGFFAIAACLQAVVFLPLRRFTR
jgi:Na+/melibiose symporter-like transporter